MSGAGMSADELLLGIDLGTQGLKIILVDAGSARVVASAGAPVENISLAPGYLEQDPQAWWRSLCQLTRGLLSDERIDPRAIIAIGLSGHMHSIVPLRADGSLARHCLVWADTRSQAQAERIRPFQPRGSGTRPSPPTAWPSCSGCASMSGRLMKSWPPCSSARIICASA